MTTTHLDILHLTISPCDHERRIFNEAISASKKGFTVKIVALKTPDLPKEEQIENIPLTRISIKNWKGGPLKFLSFNWKLWRYIRKLNFTVLHVHDVWVLPAAVLANIFGKKKVVYDAHEYIRGLEIFSRKKLSGIIWKFTEYVLIKKIDCLISINEDHQKLFRENYPEIPKSVVLKNYPRLQQIESSKAKPANSVREKVIIFQGILKKGRGLVQAIEAMQNLQSGILRIIGYGELKDELENKVRKSDLEEKIEFLGKVPLADLLSETQKARAGLVLFEPLSLNYTYASPNKFFEYVMSGTPIIASNIPTLKVLNQEFEVALLVDPFKPDSISRAMDQLLTDDNLWLRLHQNCLLASKRWNWEAQEDKLIKIYENLLKS